MQTPIGDDESQLGDLIADPNAELSDEIALRHDSARDTLDALALLNPREQEVVRKRFGLDDGRERTLQEIATDIGLTRERIRQIEVRALQKLRQKLRTVHFDALAAAPFAPVDAAASAAPYNKSARRAL